MKLVLPETPRDQRSRTGRTSRAKLVARDLVRRSRASGDGRRLELSLTPAGRRLALRAPHAAQDRLIAAVNKLPLPRRALLADVLTDLAQSVAGVRRAGMFFEDGK